VQAEDSRFQMFLLYLYHSISDATVLDITWSECGDYILWSEDASFYRNNIISIAASPQQQLKRYGFVPVPQSLEAPHVWYHPYFTSWRSELRELVELPQEFWIANSGAVPSKLGSDTPAANKRSWRHRLGSRAGSRTGSRTSSRASSPDRIAARSAVSTESASTSPQSQRQLSLEQHHQQQTQCCGLASSSSSCSGSSTSSSGTSTEAPLFTVEEVIQWCGTTGRIVPRPRGEHSLTVFCSCTPLTVLSA
jgi:hypothetical protein